MISNYLKVIMAGQRLSEEDARLMMQAMLHDEFAPEQIAGLLVALRFRGETPEELSGFLKAMRAHSVPAKVSRPNVVDTCGTGGDGANTFNISTAAAFVVAGAGVPVAKHGNRSGSSRVGSADVLEALRVPIMLSVDEVVRCVDDIGFGFFFAPLYYPTFARVRPIRNALGVPTVFNFMGPLLNPVGVKRQLIGVSNRALVPVFAELLKRQGSEEVLIVAGKDGLDEISLTSATEVAHLKNGAIKSYEIQPEDLGLTRCKREDLAGGSVFQNADLIEKILLGEEKGYKANIVLANAAATIMVSSKAKDLKEGMALAKESLEKGKAHQVLEKLRRFS
jgi:anthranilate phosphoribosyltransferase